MKYLFFLIYLFFHAYANGQSHPEIAHVLDSVVNEDQKWRKMIHMVRSGEVDSLSESDVWEKVRKADEASYFIINPLFYKHGFLGYDKVGESGSNDFWLLVQHMDKHPEFQDTVLKSMKIEVENGNASGTNYAYLIDRVKTGKDELQIYGTQCTLNKEGTSYEPNPCIEPEKLNVRRAEVGLNPIEDYINSMNEHFLGNSKKE